MRFGRKLVVLFFIMCLKKFAIGQSPSIEWQKTFGGTEDDVAYFIFNSSISGFVIIGSSESDNGDITHHVGNLGIADEDVWIIKTDSLGNIEWDKCFGGDLDESGHSGFKTNDNGYILTGSTNSVNGDVSGLHGSRTDFLVLKTDSNAVIQWQKCLGGTQMDFAYDVIQTRDSGYFVVGQTASNDGDVLGNHGGNSDDLVVKLDQNGTKEWARTVGGSGDEDIYSCKQTSDGGYLIAGSTTSNDGDVSGLNNSQDVWVVKLNPQGQLMWQKCYGGTSGDFAFNIMLSNDGGFIVAATTYSNDVDVSGLHGNNDFWLFKADSSGTIQWQKCYGGAYYESIRSSNPTSDGGIVMCGVSSADDGMVSGNHGGLFDYWVVKVDSSGNFDWGKCLGGTDREEPNSICETTDGGCIVAGYTLSSDGDITFNHGGKDYWVVKLSPLGLSTTEIGNTLMDLNISKNNDQLTVRFFSKKNENAQLFIYDVTGKKVAEKNISVTEGINYNQINCTNFSKGIYFVEVNGEKSSQREKVFVR